MAKLSKRMTGSREAVPAEAVNVTAAIDAILAQPKTKFDESIDVAIKLSIDPRHADQMVRGSISLPNGTGKTARVATLTSCLLKPPIHGWEGAFNKKHLLPTGGGASECK